MPGPGVFLAVVAALACAALGTAGLLAVTSGSSRQTPTPANLVTLLALFSLVLLRAPYLFGYTPTAGLATLAPFVAAVLWMLTRPKQPVDRRLLVCLAGFICLFAIALLRGKAAGVGTGGVRDIIVQIGTAVAATAFGVLLFSTCQTKAQTWTRLRAVALSPAVYLGVNLVLRFVGVSTTAIDPNEVSYAAGTQAKVLGLLGVHVKREAFAMNPSINGMGVIAAIGFASAALLAIRTRGLDRWLGIAGAAVSLLVLLLADTRAALVIAIMVVASLALLKRTRIALFLAVVIPFSSWIVQAAISPLPKSAVGTVLSRNNTDVATGNGRTVIWEAAQHQFSHSGIFHMLVGFGANGQATSGASQGYAYLFQGVHQPLLVHVHNLGLQMLLDCGLIGLLTLVIVVVLGISRLEAVNRLSPRSPVAALLAGALVLFITGATEPSPTYRTQEALAFALLLLSASAGLAIQPVGELASSRRRLSHGRTVNAAAMRVPNTAS